jgi:type I restriction enzyme, S subunit
MTPSQATKHWTKAQLQDLVFFQRGFDITQAQQVEGPVPVISSSGVTSYHNEAKATAPGVVIGRKGTLGSVHYSEVDYWPHDTTLWSKDFRGNNARFVFFYLQTINFKRFDVGNSNPTLNRNHIHVIPALIPPPDTQVRIADILSAYDDLLENNRRRMALLEHAGRELYGEWFVRRRFPGHEHTGSTDGLPEGWEKKRLADIADVNNESLSGSYDGHIDYVDISSVTPGSIDGIVRYEFRDAPSRARRIVKHGDIIWSCVRPNRRSHAVIWQPSQPLIVSTGFAVITPTAVPTSFLLRATTEDAFVGYLENHARGAAYPAVVASDFERAEVLVPRGSLLTAFNEVAEPLLAQAHMLRLQNEKLRAARNLLLPRLMSGEIAV